MRKIKLFLTALAVMISSVAFAQKITVTGIVTDASNGEPVIGATVHEKGTMNGVTTDLDGNYSISVPKNAILYREIQSPLDNRGRGRCPRRTRVFLATSQRDRPRRTPHLTDEKTEAPRGRVTLKVT